MVWAMTRPSLWQGTSTDMQGKFGVGNLREILRRMTGAPIINVPEEKKEGLVTQHEPDEGDSRDKKSVDNPMEIRHAILSVTFYKPGAAEVASK